MKNFKKYLDKNSIGWYISKTSRVVTRLYNEALQPYKISASQSGILIALFEAGKIGEHLNQKDISDILFLNKVNTHNLLNRLERKGFIYRVACADDCRCKHVVLTEQGKNLIPSIKQIDKRVTTILTQYFSEHAKNDTCADVSAVQQTLRGLLIEALRHPPGFLI